MENTSGQGNTAVVPQEAKGLAWGAFLWTWIWGLFNRTWIALLVLVPIAGLVVWVMLLFKGREWAWRNKHWDSVEHFNKVQSRWTKAGLIVLLVPFVLGVIAAIVIPMLEDDAGQQAAETRPPAAAAARKPAPPAAAPVAASAPAVPAAPVQSAGAAPAARLPPDEPMSPGAKPGPDARESTSIADSRRGGAETVQTMPAARGDSGDAPAKRHQPAREGGTQAPAAAAPGEPPPPPQDVVAPKYNDVMTAVIRGDVAAVTQLLELGWWVDKPDPDGFTPLMEAVAMGDAPMAELLLKRGADPNAAARNGSVLQIAKRHGNAAMAGLLRRYGATVE